MYIPKSFAWCEGNNFLPLIFNLRLVSKTLSLAVKITQAVLVRLKEILLVY